MRSTSQLRRSRHDRMIAGVCAGIAEYLGLDATAVRVAYVIFSFLAGVLVGGALLYVVLWAIIPEREYW